MKKKYRGYDIIVEFESGEVLVYKGEKLVHRAASHLAAQKWIDKREKSHGH